jgi:hypothetical protein
MDELLWVVVGDLPPAYLVTDGNPIPLAALETYVEEMQAWVNAVEAGEPVDDLIPVNVTPTHDHAKQLKERLLCLTIEIIPRYKSQNNVLRRTQ